MNGITVRELFAKFFLNLNNKLNETSNRLKQVQLFFITKRENVFLYIYCGLEEFLLNHSQNDTMYHFISASTFTETRVNKLKES